MSRLVFFVIICAIHLPVSSWSAIFGTDDREFVLSDSPIFELSKSVAVAVISSNMVAGPNQSFRLDAESSNEYLCPDQKFRDSWVLPYACTGFLVGPDLLVTAGHCATTVGSVKDSVNPYCEIFSWYFNYQLDEAGKVQRDSISESKLYKCKKVIAAIYEEKAPFQDWALIQLDRPVEGRGPLTISPRLPAPKEGKLSLIGHPMGLPKVFSPGGEVLLNNPERDQFVTSLDSVDGNSGSPVLNREGSVVGILIGGTPQPTLVYDSDLKCSRVNLCDAQGENCSAGTGDAPPSPDFQRIGSDVQRLGGVDQLIKNLRLKIR